MEVGSLASHQMTQNSKAKEEELSWNNLETMRGVPRTYRIEFPTKGGPRGFPVEGFPGKAGTRTAMRMHFCSRHVWDIVIILEEGNLRHPRCSQCDMLVPWQALNGKHHDTALCRSGEERKIRRMAETELRESTEMAFEAYGKQLEVVHSFKYLGRIMTVGYDDWPAVAGNLMKARKSWGQLKRILSMEGADKRKIGDVFQSGGSTGAAVRGGDVGADPTDREGAGNLYAWGRKKDHGETAAERVGREVVLPLSDGGHEGGGVYGDQEVHNE